MAQMAALSLATCLLLPAIPARPASATALQDLARPFIRPELSELDAVVVMMDARSTLKDIAVS